MDLIIELANIYSHPVHTEILLKFVQLKYRNVSLYSLTNMPSIRVKGIGFHPTHNTFSWYIIIRIRNSFPNHNISRRFSTLTVPNCGILNIIKFIFIYYFGTIRVGQRKRWHLMTLGILSHSIYWDFVMKKSIKLLHNYGQIMIFYIKRKICLL